MEIHEFPNISFEYPSGSTFKKYRYQSLAPVRFTNPNVNHRGAYGMFVVYRNHLRQSNLNIGTPLQMRNITSVDTLCHGLKFKFLSEILCCDCRQGGDDVITWKNILILALFIHFWRYSH